MKLSAAIVQESGGLMQQKKPTTAGRPKLPKGRTEVKIVPIRLTAAELRIMTAAAKLNRQSLSQWIRGALNAAIGE
jgi:predicted HicB family RNase H-like nuclease